MKTRRPLVFLLLLSLLFSCIAMPAYANEKMQVFQAFPDSREPAVYVALRPTVYGE